MNRPTVKLFGLARVRHLAVQRMLYRDNIDSNSLYKLNNPHRLNSQAPHYPISSQQHFIVLAGGGSTLGRGNCPQNLGLAPNVT